MTAFCVGPCWEAGWGATSEGAPGSDKLMWTEVALQSSTQCEAAYNAAHDPNALCAGASGAGACVVSINIPYIYEAVAHVPDIKC